MLALERHRPTLPRRHVVDPSPPPGRCSWDARWPRALRAALVLGLGLAGACGGSSDDCTFELKRQAVTPDTTPWVCTGSSGEPLTIVFYFDGTGSWSVGGDFQWQSTSCRTVFLDPTQPNGVAANLTELGGDVEVQRFTFTWNGEPFLCGFGAPP